MSWTRQPGCKMKPSKRDGSSGSSCWLRPRARSSCSSLTPSGLWPGHCWLRHALLPLGAMPRTEMTSRYVPVPASPRTLQGDRAPGLGAPGRAGVSSAPLLPQM